MLLRADSAWKGRLRAWASITLVVPALSCFIFRGVNVEPYDAATAPREIRSPVKAHLLDGRTVLYKDGVLLRNDSLIGNGVGYDLGLRETGPINALALDSVAAMESFHTSVNVAPTILISTLATAGVAFAGALAAAAIFGSCPTFYADSAGTPVLQAEAFPYSIAALFEARDVDGLRVRPSSDGRIRLEVRNEALETHYINQLALIEVSHARDEQVYPDPLGRPVAIRGAISPYAALDRVGRDLKRELSSDDGIVFSSDERVLESVQLSDFDDRIDLTVPAPHGADSVALVMRLQNSLLATLLLYDVMLGDPGARSLDWMGVELQRIGGALELGQWYARNMGMRFAIKDGSDYREVSWIRDTGPIAWKDVAVVVPTNGDSVVHLRLSFPADNWRIDRVAVARDFRRPQVREIPLSRVILPEGSSDLVALENLLDADERYLQTTPGQRFDAVFEVGGSRGTEARAFLLVSQGYYSEWVRRDWIRNATIDTSFVPTRSALLDAIRRWRGKRGDMPQQFESTRLPVR